MGWRGAWWRRTWERRLQHSQSILGGDGPVECSGWGFDIESIVVSGLYGQSQDVERVVCWRNAVVSPPYKVVDARRNHDAHVPLIDRDHATVSYDSLEVCVHLDTVVVHEVVLVVETTPDNESRNVWL